MITPLTVAAVDKSEVRKRWHTPYDLYLSAREAYAMKTARPDEVLFIDVRTRGPRTDRWHGMADVNVYEGGVLVEGPITDDLAVTASGFAWERGVVTYDASAASGLWVDNRDFAHHAFAVPDLGIDIQLPASKARRVDLGDVKAGEYEFVCSVPGHESMTGTLIVTG